MNLTLHVQMQRNGDLHHQHSNLLNPLKDFLIHPGILFRIRGIVEPLAAKFLLDPIKPC